MRVVFMGTPSFAVPVLAALTAEHDVVAVYTRRDRPSGRGRQERPSPVKEAALRAGLTVEQPDTLRGPEVVAALAAYRPDVVCVAAYGLILPAGVLAVPPLGCLNVHASLLPRHRGPAPIERAILEGDAVTGVSIMRMEAGLDTGPWAVRTEVEVDDLTADGLRESLARVGAETLAEVLRRLASGSVEWHPQSAADATYASKITAADVALEPSLTAAQAVRRVRASGSTAPTRAILAGRLVTVEAASLWDAAVEPGGVSFQAGHLLLGCRDGALEIARLVPAGRHSVTGAEFARGARLGPDDRWGAAS